MWARIKAKNYLKVALTQSAWYRFDSISLTKIDRHEYVPGRSRISRWETWVPLFNIDSSDQAHRIFWEIKNRITSFDTLLQKGKEQNFPWG